MQQRGFEDFYFLPKRRRGIWLQYGSVRPFIRPHFVNFRIARPALTCCHVLKPVVIYTTQGMNSLKICHPQIRKCIPNKKPKTHEENRTSQANDRAFYKRLLNKFTTPYLVIRSAVFVNTFKSIFFFIFQTKATKSEEQCKY